MRMRTKILFFSLILLAACSTKPKNESSDAADIAKKIPNLAGLYQMENEDLDDCSMQLTITEENGKYLYRLTTSNRDLKGEISMKEEDENVYVVLPTIVWDDYKGDISEKDIDENVNMPDTLDLLLYFDKETSSLNLQNYGNAMNSFIVFSECGGKFIELRKTN